MVARWGGVDGHGEVDPFGKCAGEGFHSGVFGVVMAGGDDSDAGLRGGVGDVLGDFPGEEGVGAGG